jgi:hypothetical protein
MRRWIARIRLSSCQLAQVGAERANGERRALESSVIATADHPLLPDFFLCAIGKSLLYQLPAMLNEGVTLVISPLLSLMEDQVMNLRAVGIESHMLCGTTSKEDVKYIQAQMLDKHSQMRLLFVTPEKIARSKQFLSKLERMHELGKLVRIVIDEVHCQ